MTPPPPDEFENLNELRSLRDAACDFQHPTLFGPNDCRFYAAAHAALGPEGCVTRELERLRAVSEAYADYRTTTDEVIATLQRHTKDAQKENAILLARLVKVSAAAKDAYQALEVDNVYAQRLAAVLNEIPETPAAALQRAATSTLSPCPRCGETVPTTFRNGVLTYRCMKCAGSL